MLATLLLLTPLISPQDNPFLDDFDALWQLVEERYAYLDRPGVDWKEARERQRGQMAKATSKEQALGVLENLLEALRDHHVQLNTNNRHSPRLVPSQLDLWVEWIDGQAQVTSVRLGSDAARAGIAPGDVLLEIRGQAAGELAALRLGQSVSAMDLDKPSAADIGWALRVELAGRWDQKRSLLISGDEGVHDVVLGDGWAPALDGLLRVERIATEDGFVGCVRIHNALGDSDLIHAFDEALAGLRGAEALVLDLRETPGGGNSTVARGILGHFVSFRRPYQRHALVEETRQTGITRSWLEEVSPRADAPFAGRVIVLVGRWTGSMGEGLAMGFDAIGATVVGTPMAGLLGALTEVELAHSGWRARFANEALSHVDGTPREDWIPTQRVIDTTPGDEHDDVLQAALSIACSATANPKKSDRR